MKFTNKKLLAAKFPRESRCGYRAMIGLFMLLFVAPSLVHADVSSTPEVCKELQFTTCPVPFDKTYPDAKNMLFWSQDERVVGFRNNYRMYEVDVFKAQSHKPFPLPNADYPMPEISYMHEGKAYTLTEYLENQSVTGMLILKNGKNVFEYYNKGNTELTLWTSRSVAKPIVSMLIGIAIKEGKIKSVDDPVITYLPKLAGTAWNDVTLRQLLQHTSGALWTEKYDDPESNFAQMTLCEATEDPYNCMFDLVSSVPRHPDRKPGQQWQYNTAGAWLVGLVLESATKMPIGKYLEQSIWNQFGMEADGAWHALEKGKSDMGGHGFNATLRDWGRVGQFAARDGILANNESLLPDNWIKDSITWVESSRYDAAPEGQFGYQFWFTGVDPKSKSEPKKTETSDATFWFAGIFGQAIAVNQPENLVLVQWSTWEKAEGGSSHKYDEQQLFFNAVSNALSDK